ncbi:protein of unknown function [Candidatus Filomicrobium marinum]|uniref:Uncharacterized protein n=1 Tax=Candidatus Filomicrobium marinum TaxID=1608628 RepID=A0A0D6JIJ8_9HYPH|nr:hypothetical protein [Candidatus Filomicrobium marinum]CFX42509.1 protein of unknown function [Candidatus Filomicrobium marinum]CPR21068.1 protein of unknown function [Candidatus Filomicrobium marinum]
MMFLTLQTALLLLTVYVLGAVCGCWLHRMLVAPISADDSLVAAGAAISDQPMIETATGPAPEVADLSHENRFERALVGTRLKSVGDLRSQETAPVIEAGQPPARVVVPAPAVPPYEPPSTSAPVSQGEGFPSLPAAGSSGGVTGASAPLAPSVTQSPDDLTRIHAIDEETATRLAELGMASYARLAGLTRADVDRVEASLGQQRISREGWIEQAKLLASGHETAYARRLSGKGEPLPTPAEVYREGMEPEVDTSPETSGSSEGLRDAPQEAALGEPREDLCTTEEIAKPPVEEGDDTSNADAADETAAIMAAAAVLAKAQTHTDDNQSDNDEASSTAALAPIDAPPPVTDDLLRIRGINGDAVAILSANGVNRFEQVANWNPDEVRRFEGLIGPVGRIRQENWIEQAQILAGGGETAFSRRQRLEPQPVWHEQPRFADVEARETEVLEASPEETPAPSVKDATVENFDVADAIATPIVEVPVGEAEQSYAEPMEADLSGLRSVKSPLLNGGEAKTETGYDDLKRIRGIGVLIEKKLNSLGINRYEQIANWSAAEIDRISQVLDFKGRIEREAWVEQARILASGGQTEFSSRLDRG